MTTIVRTAFTDRLGDEPGDGPGLLAERTAVTFTDLAPSTLTYRNPRAILKLQPGGSGFFKRIKVADWSNITRGIDGADNTCQITVRTLDREKIPGAVPAFFDEHFAQILAVLKPDTLVWVFRFGGADSFYLFIGYPMMSTMQWSERGQSMSFTCISRGQEELRTGEGQQILGRYMRGKRELQDNEPTWDTQEQDHKLVTALPAVFNPAGLANRTALPVAFKVGSDVNGDAVTSEIYLWTTDNHPSAERWTYAQALRTLMVLWCIDAGNPIGAFEFMSDSEQFASSDPVASSDPFETRITQRVAEVSIQSMNVDEALAVLIDAAGLHYEVGQDIKRGRQFLRVWASVENDEQADAQAGRNRTRMGVPTVHDVPRDRPFKDYSGVEIQEVAQVNAAQQATITIDSRDISAARYLGGQRDIEVSLLLRPGWPPHPQLDDLVEDAEKKAAKEFWWNEFGENYGEGRIPNSIYSSLHPDHHPVADVFRLWIFPDDAEIDAEELARQFGTWGLARYEAVDPTTGVSSFNDPLFGGGLSAGITDTWVSRSRPIRETIGRRDKTTTDRAPIVRLHFGMKNTAGDFTTTVPTPDDPGWTIIAEKPDVLLDRLAIRFIEQNIYNSPVFQSNPSDDNSTYQDMAIEAYIDGHFWVQVTGTIRRDLRLMQLAGAAGATGTRVRHQVRDLGVERFVSRDRRNAGNSYLKTLPTDDQEYEDREDFFALGDFADRRAEQIAGETVAGNLETFYLDLRFQPGDVLSGCDGLGVAFGKFPMIRSVVHTNNGGDQRTQVIVSDVRHNPEVGSES